MSADDGWDNHNDDSDILSSMEIETFSNQNADADDGLPQQDEPHQSTGDDAGNGAVNAPAPEQQLPPRVETIAPQRLFDQLVVRDTVLRLAEKQEIRHGARGKGFTWLILDVDDYERDEGTVCRLLLEDGREFRAATAKAPSDACGVLWVKIRSEDESWTKEFHVVEMKKQTGDQRNKRTRNADMKRVEKLCQMLCEEWDRVKADGPGNEADNVELEHGWQRDMRLVRQLELLLPEEQRVFGDEACKNKWWCDQTDPKNFLPGQLASEADPRPGRVHLMPVYHAKHNYIRWFCRTNCSTVQAAFQNVKKQSRPDEYFMPPGELLSLFRERVIPSLHLFTVKLSIKS